MTMKIDSYPDYMAETYDLLAYITNIGAGRIFRGNQSREVLPADNDYIVYTPITSTRHGTNIATLHAKGVEPEYNAPDTDQKLLQVDLQVDCYGHKAFNYAQGIETFARAGRCNEWLSQNKMGIRVLYANDPFNATIVDDTHQYVTRWTVMLSICNTVSTTDNIPWIDTVTVTPNPAPSSETTGIKIKNIDVNSEIEIKE